MLSVDSCGLLQRVLWYLCQEDWPLRVGLFKTHTFLSFFPFSLFSVGIYFWNEKTGDFRWKTFFLRRVVGVLSNVDRLTQFFWISNLETFRIPLSVFLMGDFSVLVGEKT